MRFTAVLGFVLLASSGFIFGSDARLRDCRVAIAMADGAPLPTGLQLSLFEGDHRIDKVKIPGTGMLSLSQPPGNYRVQIAGTAGRFVTSGLLHIDSDSPCQVAIDLPARTDSEKKILEEEVDVEDLRISGKARSLYERAFSAFTAGQLERAKEGFQQVVQADPKLGRAYNVLGVIFTQQGDRIAARNSFETALQLNPRSQTALLNLAKLSIAEKKYQEVLQLMDRYSAGNREIADVHAFKTEAYLALGKFEQAVNEAHAAHALPHSNIAYVHELAAAALEALHRPESAVDEYRLYLAEAKGNVSRELALGRIRDLTSAVASGTSAVPGNAFVSH
jgi:hypothetical protein